MLLTRDPPSGKVLEGLLVSKLQDSIQAQTIWHYTIKKFCEEEENEILTDEESVCNCILNKHKEVNISGFKATLQSVWP